MFVSFPITLLIGYLRMEVDEPFRDVWAHQLGQLLHEKTRDEEVMLRFLAAGLFLSVSLH